MDVRLAEELAAMAAIDQRVRSIPQGGAFLHRPSSAELMAWRRVDVENTDRLRVIVAERGWPGRALVGESGAEDAWLLAQHADRQLDTQRQFLAAVEAAVQAGDAPARHAAYLADRVAMNEGKPQIYGTQIADVRDGEGVPWPIADPEGVDQRRGAAGLEPFAEYVAQWRGLA
jgi:hypothetical protein